MDGLTLEEINVRGCFACQKSFEDGNIVALGDGYWHPGCFKCATCGEPIDADSTTVMLRDDQPCCATCGFSCRGCGNPIEEEAISTGEDTYHPECFRCMACGTLIDSLTFSGSGPTLRCMTCHDRPAEVMKPVPPPPSSDTVLVGHIMQKNIELDHLRATVGHHEETIAKLREAAHKAMTEFAELKEAFVAEKNAHMALQADTTARDAENLRKEYVHKDLQRLAEELESIKAQKEEAESHLRDMRSQKMGLMSEITSVLTQGESNIKERIKSGTWADGGVQAQLARLKSQFTAEMANLRLERDGLTKSIESAEQTKNGLLRQVEELREEVGGLVKEKGRLEEQVSRLHLQKIELDQQLHAANQQAAKSKGWKASLVKAYSPKRATPGAALNGSSGGLPDPTGLRAGSITNLAKPVSGKNHKLSPHTYVRPGKCVVCTDSVWGKEQRCTSCQRACHTKCQAKVFGDCIPIFDADSEEMFGAPIARVMDTEGTVMCPLIISKAVEAVEARGMDYEGIYRKSGGAAQMRTLISSLNRHVFPDFMNGDEVADIAVVTSTLKQYLRDLPTPVITPLAYMPLSHCVQDPDTPDKLTIVKDALAYLPKEHVSTLQYLIHHLYRVSQVSSINLMTARNLGVVFGPTLMKSAIDSANLEMQESGIKVAIVEYLITHSEALFGKCPEHSAPNPSMLFSPGGNTTLSSVSDITAQ